MRNAVRAYNSVSREWAEDMRRQYEHECWACNRQLRELQDNSKGAGLSSRSPPNAADVNGPRAVDPDTIVIHGDLGLTPELLEANEELERRMSPYRRVEARE